MIKVLVFCLALASTIQQNECSTTRDPVMRKAAKSTERSTKEPSKTDPEGKDEAAADTSAVSNSAENITGSISNKTEKAKDLIQTTAFKDPNATRSATSRLPFSLVTMDYDSHNMTAQLIRLVQRAWQVPSSRKSAKSSENQQLYSKAVNKPIRRRGNLPFRRLSLLYTPVNVIKKDERRYVISNFDVIESYMKSRKSKNDPSELCSKDAMSKREEKFRASPSKLPKRRKNHKSHKRSGGNSKKKRRGKEMLRSNDNDQEGIHYKLNYDERIDDYIVTTDAAELGEDQWSISKKLNWDDIHSSNERSKEKKETVDKEQEKLNERDKEKDSALIVKKTGAIYKAVAVEPIVNDNWANENADNQENSPDLDKVVKKSAEESSSNNKQNSKEEEYEKINMQKINKQLEIKEDIDALIDNARYRDESSNQYKQKINDGPEKTSKLNKLQKKGKPGRSGRYEKSYESEMQDIVKTTKNENSKSTERLEKVGEPEQSWGRNHPLNKLKKIIRNHHNKYKSTYDIKGTENLKIGNNNNFYEDYRENRKTNLNDDYNQKTAESRKEHDEYNDPTEKIVDKTEKSRDHYNLKKDSMNIAHKPRVQVGQTDIKWSDEGDDYNGRHEEKSKYTDDYNMSRDKKGKNTHVDSINDWAEVEKLSYNDDSRAPKSVQNSNSKYENYDEKGKDATKSKHKQRDDYNNWNRHENNDWDKVGVREETRRTIKEFNPHETTTFGATKKTTWDRHANNDWDSVGKGNRDVEAPRVEKRRPKSHNNNEKSAPSHYGYGHTSLPHRERKSVYDDD